MNEPSQYLPLYENLIWKVSEQFEKVDVVELRFYFAPLYSFEVSDPQISEQFIDAIRSTPEPMEDDPCAGVEQDSLTFILKPEKARVLGGYPIITFKAKHLRKSWIDFRAAFDALQRYLADQVHRTLEEHADDIASIQVRCIEVTKPEERAQVITVLKQVDERSFAFREKHSKMSVTLILQQGEVIDFMFALDHSSLEQHRESELSTLYSLYFRYSPKQKSNNVNLYFFPVRSGRRRIP